MTKLYLAGPMSGYPQFNFPLFMKAAQDLRERGLNIVNPAELDTDDDREAALNSKDGSVKKLERSYSYFLSRDVEIVCDEVGGIVFLPNWSQSKGARLEAYVSLQEGHDEYWYYEPWAAGLYGLASLTRAEVARQVSGWLLEGAEFYNSIHGLGNA